MFPICDLAANYSRSTCVKEAGYNVYAPKVLILFERSSTRAVAPLLVELCARIFKSYESGQIYFDFYEPGIKHEGLEIVHNYGMRLCYTYKSNLYQGWVLQEAGGDQLGYVSEAEAISDKRCNLELIRPNWNIEPIHVSEKKKPKIAECDCGLCDYCVELY